MYKDLEKRIELYWRFYESSLHTKEQLQNKISLLYAIEIAIITGCYVPCEHAIKVISHNPNLFDVLILVILLILLIILVYTSIKIYSSIKEEYKVLPSLGALNADFNSLRKKLKVYPYSKADIAAEQISVSTLLDYLVKVVDHNDAVNSARSRNLINIQIFQTFLAIVVVVSIALTVASKHLNW